MKRLFAILSFTFCSGLLALAGAPACDSSVDPPRQDARGSGGGSVADPKVVVFVIDGARRSETFGDSTHAHISHVWNDLRPLGAIVGEFRNDGATKTVPGHAALSTGTWQNLANDGSQRPDMPTFFEYYRAATSAAVDQAYVISGKSKLKVCAYGTHASYGPAVGATARVGLAGDDAVFNELASVLKTQRPRLVLACLPDVDYAGHSGVWPRYIAAIENADSLALETWRTLQADSFYAGQTYLLITNDHGRHDDAHGGFQSHGDSCEGCRRLMFLALGPDIRPGAVVDSTFTQRDVCATVGRILGFPTPLVDGREMSPLFVGAGATPRR